MSKETLSPAQIASLAQAGKIMELDGRPALGIGVVALFLFTDGASAGRRAAVAACVRDYAERAGKHLRWWSREGSATEFTAASLSSLETEPAYGNAKAVWSASLSSGEKVTDAAPFDLSFVCQPSWEPVGVSRLQVQFPLDHLDSDFILLFQRFASLLRVDQAYAGAGVLQRPGTAVASPYAHLVYALANRFPGLEVFSPSAVWESLNLRNALGPANWLTAVGDRFLARLGGWPAAAQGLDERVTAIRYEGGVILMAGSKPELGDSQAQLQPTLYREVARVLRPVRFTGPQGGFYRPSPKGPTLDANAVPGWLARFD